MSLPFLAAKKMASVIVAQRKASGSLEPQGEEGESNPILIHAAEELISAIHMKSAERVAAAFKTAFLVLESEPHHEEEGNQ